MNITSCLAGQLQDTRLTVYDACETLVQVAYNDDAFCSAVTGGNSYASDVTFDIVAGETYKIFWDDYWSLEHSHGIFQVRACRPMRWSVDAASLMILWLMQQMRLLEGLIQQRCVLLPI